MARKKYREFANVDVIHYDQNYRSEQKHRQQHAAIIKMLRYMEKVGENGISTNFAYEQFPPNAKRIHHYADALDIVANNPWICKKYVEVMRKVPADEEILMALCSTKLQNGQHVARYAPILKPYFATHEMPPHIKKLITGNLHYEDVLRIYNET
ncbi:MAG: hypothetical protein IJ184_07105 [Alphaproteobacteria bacterium]|nr:hypothetical protein [Alphaproteobacteria bacterium]